MRQHGIQILGEAVVKGEHTFYMIVQAPDEASVATFMRPFARVGTAEVYPASTCAKVITSGGCTVEAPASSPDVMDPEEACQRAIEAALVVHCAHPLNGETSIPALIGGVVMPSAHFYVRTISICRSSSGRRRGQIPPALSSINQRASPSPPRSQTPPNRKQRTQLNPGNSPP